MLISPFKLIGALVLGTALTSTVHAATKPAYHLAATWKLAGDGGWDYLTVDSKAHRLYIARGTQIQVLDTESGVQVGQVDGLQGAHGVALDVELGRGFATSGRDNHVVPFDLKSLQPVGAPIVVGTKPDAITFEPTTGHIFAWNAGDNSASAIDPQSGQVLGAIALGGNPEFAVADGEGHLFVNIEGTSELLEIDAKSLTVMSRHPLAPGEEPTGLAYDAKKKVLFSGCANNILAVLNATDGKALADLPIGGGVDATTFDPKLGLAFSSNGADGTATIVGADEKGQYAVLGTLQTHRGARTMALDPKTHALFFVAADYEAAAPAAAGERPRRPKMIPGSVVVLKFERDR